MVTHLSWKLCFLAAVPGWGVCDQGTPSKQGFGDKGVPKQELGNEVPMLERWVVGEDGAGALEAFVRGGRGL